MTKKSLIIIITFERQFEQYLAEDENGMTKYFFFFLNILMTAMMRMTISVILFQYK